MIRVLRILLLISIVSALFYFSGGLGFLNKTVSTVRAFGDLMIDFHVPPGNPIFVVNNMAPGQVETRSVDATNSGTVARLVAVRGVKTSTPSTDPQLESGLDIVIGDGVVPLYGSGSGTGAKTLADFFADSTSSGGVQLNTILPSGNKTYNFKVTFPDGAGNDFQAKSVVFDLTFGIVTADHLVINEVYYQVDGSHGLDSPKDRGIVGVGGGNVTLVIKNNGAGSVNTITVSQSEACKILQANTTNVGTNVSVNSNSGGNSVSGNTGGLASIIAGAARSVVSVIITGSTNSSSGCGKSLGQNDEWVELFNPTDHDISLKNWSLSDNSGSATKINANKTIKAGGFALLSKSASTWTFWTVAASATKVELGGNIGDGLDNSGDHLILKNPGGVEADRMSWGTDTTGFTPPAVNAVVPLGDSTTRVAAGADADGVSDWIVGVPPTPGN